MRRVKVDAIEQEWFNKAISGTTFEVIDALMRPYLGSTKSEVRMMRA